MDRNFDRVVSPDWIRSHSSWSSCFSMPVLSLPKGELLDVGIMIEGRPWYGKDFHESLPLTVKFDMTAYTAAHQASTWESGARRESDQWQIGSSQNQHRGPYIPGEC